MRLPRRLLPVLLWPCLFCTPLCAQDSSVYRKLYSLPDKFFASLDDKAQQMEARLNKQTDKYLSRIERQERKLQQKLQRKDSAAAKEIFGDVANRYGQLKSRMADQGIYSGRLDSLQTALRFLERNNLFRNSSLTQLSLVFSNYKSLQGKFNQTAEIKKYLKERQQFLRQQLEKFGLSKELKKFQKAVYYYGAQMDEYKRTLEDPSKLEAKLLQLATKIPAFKEFFRKHSMLASLFRLPGSDAVASATPIPGLQTRAAIQQDMLQRFGSAADVSRVLQQNVQDAQAQIDQLKNKVSQLGGSSSDMDMPDFKPNTQKTKSFWKRVEFGANVQSTRSNNFFPVTSDIGLSAGYKLNDKSMMGVGVSYKLGWGQNIRNIRITHEGIALRGFAEIKLKGSIWITGGAELNYRSRFYSLQVLKDYSAWQQSALIGLTKKYNINKKFNGNLQLLFDALYARQVPGGQPILFRLRYTLK